MPSSIFLLLLTCFSFLRTLDLCSASPQNPNPGPSPSGPGFQCTFQPVSGFGPDTTTPEYNAGMVSQDSVSNYIQCAGEPSNLQLGDGEQPVKALDILVNATKTCEQCKLSKVIQNYAQMDRSVSLTQYLCGKVDNSDLCALSQCIGAREPEHGLEGVCQNSNVNLFDNQLICGAGDGGGGAATAAASSSTPVANASDSTATATTSSNSDIAMTTSPAQTPSNTAAAGPSPSSNAASRMLTAGLGRLIATGVWLIVPVAGL